MIHYQFTKSHEITKFGEIYECDHNAKNNVKIHALMCCLIGIYYKIIQLNNNKTIYYGILISCKLMLTNRL